MVYNGYYKVMSNIPKMGQLPTPVVYMFLYGKAFFNEVEWLPILLFIHIKLGQVENYMFLATNGNMFGSKDF